MFKKIIKQFLIVWLIYFFIPVIGTRILFILFPRKNQGSVIFLPLWVWILFLILSFVFGFMKVYTDNKNWPRKKK